MAPQLISVASAFNVELVTTKIDGVICKIVTPVLVGVAMFVGENCRPAFMWLLMSTSKYVNEH